MDQAVSVSVKSSIRDANQALAKNDLSAARAELDKLMRLSPGDVAVLMLEARVVEAEKSESVARPLYRRVAEVVSAALEKRPTANRAVMLAGALCKCGDLEAARAALATAKRLGAHKDHLLRAERAVAFAGEDLAARRRAAEAVVDLADGADVWDWMKLAIVLRAIGDRDAAAAAAARALELDPGNVKARDVAVWAAVQQTPGAPRVAMTPSPESTGPAEWIEKSQRALTRNDVSGALAALEDVKRSWPDDPDVLMLEARIADVENGPVAAKGLYRKAINALSASLEKKPDGVRFVALANALCKCGELEGAAKALEDAARLGAARPSLLRVERAIAFARADLPAMRRAAEAILESGDRVNAWDWVNLAIACRDLDDLETAAAAAARAIELDPVLTQAARISSWVAVRQGNGEKAIEELRRAAALSPDDPRLALQVARTLSFSGRVAEAADEILRALERWPHNSALRWFALLYGVRTLDQLPENSGAQGSRNLDHFREAELRRLSGMLPADRDLLRPAIVNDVSKDVIIGKSERSDKVVLVFTALNDAVNMPIAMFDRYLAALGLSAIYLKDFNRVSHLQGVVSLGDSLLSTISALRGLLADMRARRVYCIGASAGGFAAIRYGAELAVERVLSFAGQTYDPPRDHSKLELNLALIRRRRGERFSSQSMDLAPLLRSLTSGTRFELFYPVKSPRDTEHAKHLEGIEGVTLHPVADCEDHELLQWIALREDMGARLARLLGDS